MVFEVDADELAKDREPAGMGRRRGEIGKLRAAVTSQRRFVRLHKITDDRRRPSAR